MTFRRSHRKSRHGCNNCKRRRVKCDEGRPICANCDQRHDTCVYNTSAPFKFPEEQDAPLGRPGSQRQSEPAGPASESPNVLNNFDVTNPSSTPPTLDMKSLELVLQWIKHTHRFFARNEETRRLWEMPVLQEALQAPFLMHGILALSALHLSHFQSNQESSDWLNTALAHKNTALSMFSEQLPNITQVNAKAMMSFAGLAVAFSFASALNLIPSGEGPSLSSLTNIFTLSRGVQTVINAESKFLRESNFFPLFDIKTPDEPIPDQFLNAFERLEKLNVECYRQLQDHEMVTYQRAIAYMRELAPFTFAEPTSLTLLVGWAIRAPGKYFEDLNESNPFALVVLAHYCVFMHLARKNWCVGSWGRIVLQEISQNLAPEWHNHIGWALEQVSTTPNENL
ncbi:uncharacterized protein N7469_005432 [Penicillium citrinum]|uniref:Zn(2)-C6 fungal-type domain-containing protein n=1 Tax=Penicillium citrinum TaxID=5077 RepID=A0A9W9P1Q9_PENCI|nr:uncharacterized protein N7469_005432 [Penicillium citrinum]KAJ5233666.1 hypothetical protein N7469_005432 [Penicillium citrinum]